MTGKDRDLGQRTADICDHGPAAFLRSAYPHVAVQDGDPAQLAHRRDQLPVQDHGEFPALRPAVISAGGWSGEREFCLLKCGPSSPFREMADLP